MMTTAAVICVGLLLVLLSVRAQVGDYKYVVELQSDRIYTPCEEAPDNYITNWFDTSKLDVDLEDERVHVYGQWSIVKEFDNNPIEMDLQMLKYSRGQWVSTIYNMKRLNFCNSLFNPTEYWYSTIQFIKEEDRICPLQKITVDMDVWSNLTVNLVDRNFEGQYKVVTKLIQDDDFICFELHFTAYQF